MLKFQEASSILRVGFALSKYPNFNSTYLVKVRFLLDLAVYNPFIGLVTGPNVANEMFPDVTYNYDVVFLYIRFRF